MHDDRFTAELWASIEEVYGATLAHPFNVGLTDGTLGREAFQFSVVQDGHYLREYARALALLAARAPSEAEIVLLCVHAEGGSGVEQALHDEFLDAFGMSEADAASTPAAPMTLAYTSYLLAACHDGSFAEALAAVLPCYWIYWEVGKRLLERGSPDPHYRRWIETASSDEFGEGVEAVHALADGVGAELVGSVWDRGDRMETWPV